MLDMVEKIRQHEYTDFDNPKYYNIHWMRLLEKAHQIIQVTGSVFEAPIKRRSEEAKVVTLRSAQVGGGE